jgi:hypothetical protein
VRSVQQLLESVISRKHCYISCLDFSVPRRVRIVARVRCIATLVPVRRRRTPVTAVAAAHRRGATVSRRVAVLARGITASAAAIAAAGVAIMHVAHVTHIAVTPSATAPTASVVAACITAAVPAVATSATFAASVPAAFTVLSARVDA